MSMPRAAAFLVLRYLWALPATALGAVALGLAVVAGARVRRIDGTLEVAGGCVRAVVAALPRRLRFDAITLGHVIVGVDHARLAALRVHERVHVAQYERWGPLFIPLYLGASLVAWIDGEDPCLGNAFEREARRAESAGGTQC
jgi:hypothetical protein